MAYTEKTKTGYGSRVGASFKAIGTGILLFVAGTVLLWWNEGRAVKTAQMLKEAEKSCVIMENPNKIDRAMDGELVCATAVATTNDSLVDNQFGIGATAIALKRNVSYYQWVEHSETKTEDKVGGEQEQTTVYTYNKEWVSKPVNSSKFKNPAYQNKNTVIYQVEKQDFWAKNVTFGAYKLNESLIRSISSREPVNVKLTEEQLDQMNRSLADNSSNMNYLGLKKMVHPSGNEIYLGNTPSTPQIGDVKVSFEKIVPAKVTIVSQVDNDTFKPFKAKNGQQFQTLVMGQKSADEIFQAENDSNTFLTWLLRIIGIGVIIGGLKGIFGFLEALLKVLPFLANIIGWGVGVICTVMGTVWSLIIIAIAWLFYRPVLGITLLLVAGFLVWVFAFKGKEKLQKLASQKAQGASPVPQE